MNELANEFGYSYFVSAYKHMDKWYSLISIEALVKFNRIWIYDPFGQVIYYSTTASSYTFRPKP